MPSSSLPEWHAYLRVLTTHVLFCALVLVCVKDCLIEDNPENGTNEASAAGCSNRNLLLPCSNPEASDDAPITSQAVDTISAASETGNYLPIAVDTTTGTSKAVIGLPITVDTSAAPSRPSNQLFIMAVDTATATSKTVNRIPIKPNNTSATKHQPGSQPSIKAVGTVSAINEINNQVSSKSIVDTVSADNKYGNQLLVLVNSFHLVLKHNLHLVYY